MSVAVDVVNNLEGELAISVRKYRKLYSVVSLSTDVVISKSAAVLEDVTVSGNVVVSWAPVFTGLVVSENVVVSRDVIFTGVVVSENVVVSTCVVVSNGVLVFAVVVVASVVDVVVVEIAKWKEENIK